MEEVTIALIINIGLIRKMSLVSWKFDNFDKVDKLSMDFFSEIQVRLVGLNLAV